MALPIPPIPIEIISKILSHLGKNDLLKCRLVSQSWKELSLEILRNPKYGHEYILKEYHIQNFVEFWKERNEEWILPFHVKCRGYGKSSKVYPQIPEYIQQLQTIFGEECVVGLTLRHYSSSLESVKELISILTLIAPSLTHLDLSRFRLTYVEEKTNTKVKEMLGKTDLNFPNLSRLKSCPKSYRGRHVHDRENEIHSFLIKNSLNLKDLEVIRPYDLLVIQRHIANLRKLKIVKPFVMKGLDLDTILEPFRTNSHTLPVIKDLSLTYKYNTGIDDQILYEFLSPFSTSLKSLTVVWEDIPKEPFPRLSHLRLLRIQTSSTRARHVDPTVLNLNSEGFPALESIDIPSNVYVESTDSNSGNSKDDWILPTVKNLIIRVTDSRSDSKVSIKDYVDQLQGLFPNVTSLTLVNESDGHEEYLNQLLIALIQSDGAPKIQELEIQNCEKNYLGHILNGLDTDRQPRVIIENMSLDEEFLKAIEKAFQVFSGGSRLSVDKQLEFRDGDESRMMTCEAPVPIHFKMTGLEKIRMSLLRTISRRPSEREREREPNQKDLFLMSLPKHFPLLKQIHISQRMFGSDHEFCKQQIINVREKFPDLIIIIN